MTTSRFLVPLFLGLWMQLLVPGTLRGDQLRGIVRDGAFDPDSQPTPLAGVLVRCRPGEASAKQIRRRTDADGRFKCENLPAGPIAVEYEKLGYVPRPGVKELHLAGQADLDLELFSSMPKSTSYWQHLATRIADQEENEYQYVLALERLKGFGLPPEGLTTTAGHLARALSADQAHRFGEQLAVLDITLPERPMDPRDQVASLPPAVLTGQLTDSEGVPLPGITVTASSTSRGMSRSVVTRADGSYRFYGLPAGRYDITVALEGFPLVSSTVDLRAGESSDLALRLPIASDELKNHVQ